MTLKRPSSTISPQEPPEVLQYKRARPGPNFYSRLDKGNHSFTDSDDNLHDQSFNPDDNLHDQPFINDDNLHDQESQSIKSPAGEKDSNDWKDEIIYECVSLGIKCNGAMRLINKFILAKKLNSDFYYKDAQPAPGGGSPTALCRVRSPSPNDRDHGRR